MSDSELKTFWQSHQAEELKLIGDRLLAECLPRYEERAPEFYSPDLAEVRENLGLSPEVVARRLGVTRNLLHCWEQGDIRPPASLRLIYDRLKPAPQ